MMLDVRFDSASSGTDATWGGRTVPSDLVTSKSAVREFTPFAVPNRIQRAYDVALSAGREHDWERFIDEACALSTRATDDEVATLLVLAQAQHGSYRPATALARVLAAYAEIDRSREHALTGLWYLLRHRSAEVRCLVLEAAADLGAEERRLFARALETDEHPQVQRLARDLAG